MAIMVFMLVMNKIDKERVTGKLGMSMLIKMVNIWAMMKIALMVKITIMNVMMILLILLMMN